MLRLITKGHAYVLVKYSIIPKYTYTYNLHKFGLSNVLFISGPGDSTTLEINRSIVVITESAPTPVCVLEIIQTN